MIVTAGGRFGGYGLYLLKGKPVFLYNFLDLERSAGRGRKRSRPGKHTLEFDFKYDGMGPGIRPKAAGHPAPACSKVDGKEVATKNDSHKPSRSSCMDETFDVGVDTRTGVDDARLPGAVPLHRQDRQADRLGSSTATAEDIKQLRT